MNIALLLFIAASAHATLDSYETHEVKELPGLLKPIKFKHYSGFLNVSSTHRLHYWFVESQNDPVNDPLLVWMNGGPGCSSLDGMLNELGPFHMNDDGATITLNPYSWNQMANIIFLEAPAGVGFSYSTDDNVTTDDKKTASENYRALKLFFDMYPQFRKNDFYIGGESYGGIYVPTLSELVINGNATYSINLKGMYIGNGYLSADLNTDTMIEYGYAHGVMSEHDWDFSIRTCCNGCADFCPFHSAHGGLCEEIVQNTTNRMWMGGLNPYDIYRDCAFPADAWTRRNSRLRITLKGLAGTPPLSKAIDAAILNEYKHLTSNAANMKSDPGQPACMNDTAIEMYLNRPDVQRALHVDGHSQRWTLCSEQVEMAYNKVYRTMQPQFALAIERGLRVLVYNGDTDMACNFLLGQRFVQALDLELLQQKQQWYHMKQVAGFWTKYKNLDFITVKGAGHMVPQWRSAQSLHMMYRYLKNMPY